MNNRNSKFEILNDIIIRTPALPFSFVLNFVDNQYSAENIIDFLNDPKIREAIFIASPSLILQIDTLDAINQKKRDRIVHALVKYLTRMSTRATPFGLLAGVFTATFGDATKIKIDTNNPSRRTRLNYDVLAMVHDHLTAENQVKMNLSYNINTSLYPIGDDYRYIKSVFNKEVKNYALEQIKSSESLVDILSLVKDGVPIEQCLTSMVSIGYNREETLDFINNLIETKILVPESAPYLVGGAYLKRFIRTLEEKVGENYTTLSNLKELSNKLYKLDQNKINSISEYDNIKADLNRILKSDSSNIVQVDLFVNAIESSIDRKEKNIIYRGLNVLSKISYIKNTNRLTEFKNQFMERYAGNPVKLVEVLDADSGLGYPLNQKKGDYWYLSGLDLGYKEKKQAPANPTEFDAILKNKVNYLRDDNKIEITDQDLALIPDTNIKMPATFYALTERYVQEGKPYYYMPTVGGSTAGSLIGRFSGYNKNIDNLMQTIADLEQEFHNDAICADIDHIPEKRTGNVLFRSNFRKHIIPFLSGKENNGVKYISVTDIYLSVLNGDLILTHESSGKKIVPYLSNAHNYKRSLLPIYMFLCDLQFSYCTSALSFEWGILGKTRVYLPRVVYKDIILSKARWKLNKKLLNEFFINTENVKTLAVSMERFVKFWKLPRFVSLVHGDNLLFLDLSSEIGIELFITETRSLETIVLEEFIQSDKHSISNQKREGHLNQLLFTFKTNNKK